MDIAQGKTGTRTNLQYTRAGSLVNLERFPQGRRAPRRAFCHRPHRRTAPSRVGNATGSDHVLEIRRAPDVMRYLVFKGSIAVDGISSGPT